MPTRDQRFAKQVFEQVSAFKRKNTNAAGKIDDKKIKQYGSMAHKLPVMIRSAGLAQTLAFVNAKSKKREAYKQLLADLADALEQENADNFIEQSRIASLDDYMFLTQNALAALLWYKRYAQSVLEVESGEETDDEDDEANNDGEQKDGVK